MRTNKTIQNLYSFLQRSCNVTKKIATAHECNLNLPSLHNIIMLAGHVICHVRNNLRMAKHTKCVQAVHDEGEGEISQRVGLTSPQITVLILTL